MLEITVENHPDGRVRVALKGRLDTQTYAQCEERIRPLLTATTRVLLFDMAGVDYLSSMGLRVLMKTAAALGSHGGRCVLARLQPPIRKVIEIANALPKEAVFASVEEADRYLDHIQRQARQEAQNPPKPLRQ
ncbi:MAG: STAS domain-containing protein [Verrucomicrobia bacterium]|nr:STAS domain-containing protein [Verrucomicrobiota bacterium]